MLKVVLLCVLATVVVGASNRRLNPRCGLPSFTSRLPSDAQEKIEKIWESYKDGKECDKEHKATKTIVSWCSLCAIRPKGPAFLIGASDEVRAQFDNLWKDHSIPREEKPEKFKELAEKNLVLEISESGQYRSIQVEQLTPEARAAHEKLTKLREERHKVRTVAVGVSDCEYS
ncbi:unnamed protein product [Haemonchus placei]|uniref:Secreted protein n=1 Tax=Haemonchus placei TaxID=6290 RepID=A0A0N4WFC5_HAEPC|nr:unnamed protein product [Haemonchus placei]